MSARFGARMSARTNRAALEEAYETARQWQQGTLSRGATGTRARQRRSRSGKKRRRSCG